MGGYKYLARNIGLLTISSFASKILSFFLVPLYTSILTTSEYGTFDLFSTTITILVPVLTLDIQSALLRFSLDDEFSNTAAVSISIRFILASVFIVCIGIWINYVISISQVIKAYSIFFILLYFINSLTGIVISYTRGTDKIRDLSISSFISAVIVLVGNIFFLVVLKWGLSGYFIANISAGFFQCMYLIVRTNMLSNLSLRKSFHKERKEMTSYSKPLVLNSIGWWVNSVSDRYIVVLFCGLATNGIYAVASKIPSILNVFQGIFNQAWTLSTVKDYDPLDRSGFFTNTYKAYNCFLTIICSLIIILDKVLAGLLYAKDFFVAWKYVPWLTIAIVFGALSGCLGGFFTATKNSKLFAKSTIIGAVSNIILNFILTPIIGPLGAAIATTISYILTWSIRFLDTKRVIQLRLCIFRDIVSYAILILQAVFLLVFNELTLYLLECLLFGIILCLYYQDFFACLKMVLCSIQKRRSC